MITRRFKRYRANMGPLWTAVNLSAFAWALYAMSSMLLLMPEWWITVLFGTTLLFCLVAPAFLLTRMVRNMRLTGRVMQGMQFVLIIGVVYHFTGGSGLPLWGLLTLPHLLCFFIGMNLCVLSDPRVLTANGQKALMSERVRQEAMEERWVDEDEWIDDAEAEAFDDEGLDEAYEAMDEEPQRG